MKIIILGGGFIGQLLHVLYPMARVFDWRPVPPKIPARQLGAQYLWEPIEELCNHRFTVHTTIDGVDATPESVMRYKRKVGKESEGGDWEKQFQPVMNGYDCQLPDPRVEYGKRVTHINTSYHRLTMSDSSEEPYDYLFSSIPFTALLQLCGLNATGFRSTPIQVCTRLNVAEFDPTAMLVNYVSGEVTSVYRETIRNGHMYTESLQQETRRRYTTVFPGKIYAHPFAQPAVERLAGIGIFCMGRFGAWAPEELAHETYRKAKALRAQLR